MASPVAATHSTQVHLRLPAVQHHSDEIAITFSCFTVLDRTPHRIKIYWAFLFCFWLLGDLFVFWKDLICGLGSGCFSVLLTISSSVIRFCWYGYGHSFHQCLFSCQLLQIQVFSILFWSFLVFFLDDHYQHCELDKRLNKHLYWFLTEFIKKIVNHSPQHCSSSQLGLTVDQVYSQRSLKIVEIAEPEAVGPGRYPVSKAVQMGTKAIWRGQPLLIPGRLSPERVIRIGKFGISVWILMDRVLKFALLLKG